MTLFYVIEIIISTICGVYFGFTENYLAAIWVVNCLLWIGIAYKNEIGW